MAKRMCCYTVFLTLWLSHLSFAQWTNITNPQLGNITNIKFISPTNGWLINLSNTPPQGLLRTTDGGLIWVKILDHPPGIFNWLVDFDFYDDSLGYALSLGKYFRTTTGGRMWDTLHGGSNPNSRIFSPSLAFSGGSYLYKSTDSLHTWSLVSIVPDYGSYPSDHRLAFLSPTSLIACGGSSALLLEEWTGTIECNRSTDSGLTWQLTYIDTMINAQAVAFANNDIGYVFTTLHSSPGIDPHEVNLKTTDGGASWFSIPAHIPAGSFGIIEAYFQNPDVGFVSGNGGLARTTDAGITWNIVPGITGNFSYMSWPDSLHGWVVGGDGKIFRTTDGGGLPVQLASFTGIHLGGTRVHLDWRTISEVNNYGFHVMRRQENEPTFTQISPLIPGHGTTNEPQHYSWTDSNATSARWYYKLRQIDLDGTEHYSEPILVDVTTGVSEQNMPRQYKLEQNYPNPFNPSTTIEYDLPELSHVSLIVYDVLGRKVTELVNGTKEAGYHSATWNASDIASGVYFGRFTATDGSGNVKLSKVNKLLLAK